MDLYDMKDLTIRVPDDVTLLNVVTAFTLGAERWENEFSTSNENDKSAQTLAKRYRAAADAIGQQRIDEEHWR